MKSNLLLFNSRARPQSRWSKIRWCHFHVTKKLHFSSNHSRTKREPLRTKWSFAKKPHDFATTPNIEAQQIIVALASTPTTTASLFISSRKPFLIAREAPFFLVAWQELPSLFKDTFEWASQKNSDWSFFVPFSGHFVTLLLLATETDGRILKSWSIHRFVALLTYQINEIFASECCALQKCFLWDTLDTFWTWKRRYFPGEFIQLHFVWKFPGVGQIFSDF